VLAALAAAFVAAFVVGPRLLAGGGVDDERDLVDAVRVAFVGYWRSGDRAFPPELERMVGYWTRYHLAKAAFAAILLVVLVALGVLLWRAFSGAARGGAVLASAGVLVTVLGSASAVAVMANVQGAVAPFASLLPMLTAGPADGELAGTLDQVRQRLTELPAAGGRTPPAVTVMISDFARFHAAMAVIAAIVAVVLLALSVLSWRRFAATGSSGSRARRVSGSFGVLSALSALIVILVAVANTTTAADPTPALLAFFNGGW
jgi:hypothetical protein